MSQVAAVGLSVSACSCLLFNDRFFVSAAIFPSNATVANRLQLPQRLLELAGRTGRGVRFHVQQRGGRLLHGERADEIRPSPRCSCRTNLSAELAVWCTALEWWVVFLVLSAPRRAASQDKAEFPPYGKV